MIIINSSAEVAELVDAPGSGSGGRKPVGVRVSSSAPTLIAILPADRSRVFILNRAAKKSDLQAQGAEDDGLILC